MLPFGSREPYINGHVQGTSRLGVGFQFPGSRSECGAIVKKSFQNNSKYKWGRYHKTPRKEHRPNVLWNQPYKCFLGSVTQGNQSKNKNKIFGVPIVAQLLMNPTRNNEVSGLISGLAQWVKGSGIASAVAQIQSLPRNFHMPEVQPLKKSSPK